MRYLITLSTLVIALMSFNIMAEDVIESPPVVAKKAVLDTSNRKKHKIPKKIPKSANKTIRYVGGRVIEEYRVRGRLTMVKVISKKAKPYFIYYNENWNSSPASQDLDDTQKKPTWKIFSW